MKTPLILLLAFFLISFNEKSYSKESKSFFSEIIPALTSLVENPPPKKEDGTDIVGDWVITTSSKNIIEITKCPVQKKPFSVYCLKLKKLEHKKDHYGKTKTDRRNPKVELKTRPLEGIPLSNSVAYIKDIHKFKKHNKKQHCSTIPKIHTNNRDFLFGSYYKYTTGKTIPVRLEYRSSRIISIATCSGFSILQMKRKEPSLRG